MKLGHPHHRQFTVPCAFCGHETVLIAYPSELSEEQHFLRGKAVALVEESPGRFTRSELANALGTRRHAALAVIERLIVEGVLGPAKPRARLRVMRAPYNPAPVALAPQPEASNA
jgi:hypothetical protein